MTTWIGRAPASCQLCSARIEDGFADARLSYGGQWANMCLGCHKMIGSPVGEGRGQVYRADGSGRFVCVEGGRRSGGE